MVESRPRSADHPKAHRAIGRPKMHETLRAVAQAASQTVANQGKDDHALFMRTP